MDKRTRRRFSPEYKKESVARLSEPGADRSLLAPSLDNLTEMHVDEELRDAPRKDILSRQLMILSRRYEKPSLKFSLVSKPGVSRAFLFERDSSHFIANRNRAISVPLPFPIRLRLGRLRQPPDDVRSL